MPFSRRQMLSTTALTGVGAIAAIAAAPPAAADAPENLRHPGGPDGRSALFGPLKSGVGDLLALPAGFGYEVVSVSGVTAPGR